MRHPYLHRGGFAPSAPPLVSPWVLLFSYKFPSLPCFVIGNRFVLKRCCKNDVNDSVTLQYHPPVYLQYPPPSFGTTVDVTAELQAAIPLGQNPDQIQTLYLVYITVHRKK